MSSSQDLPRDLGLVNRSSRSLPAFESKVHVTLITISDGIVRT